MCLCGAQLTHAHSETKRVNQRLLDLLKEHSESLAEREAAESRVSEVEAQLHDLRVRMCDCGLCNPLLGLCTV